MVVVHICHASRKRRWLSIQRPTQKFSDVVLLVPSCRAKKSESSVSRRISNENGIEKPCFFKVLGLVELRVKNLQRTKAFEN